MVRYLSMFLRKSNPLNRFLLFLCVIGLSFFTKGLGFIVLCAALVCFIIYKNTDDPDERKFIISIFAAAFLLRTIVALIYQWYVLRWRGGLPFMTDESFYLALGWYQALIFKMKDLSRLSQEHYAVMDSCVRPIFEGWIAYRGNAGLSLRGGGPDVFGLVLSLPFFIFGYSLLLPRFLNILIGSLTALIVYYIAKAVFGKNVGKISFALFAFLPPQIFLSISILRDIILGFFAVALLLLFYKMKDIKSSITHSFLLLLILFTSYFFGVGFACLLSLILGTAVVIRILDFKKGKRKIFSLVLLTALILYTGLDSRVVTHLNTFVKHSYYALINRHIAKATQVCESSYVLLPDKFYNIDYEFNNDNKVDEILASKKGFSVDQLDENPLSQAWQEDRNDTKRDLRIAELGKKNALSAYFKGLFYVFFKPFPWHIKKLTHVFASIHMIILYILFPFMCIGLFNVFRSPTKKKSILAIFFFVFVSVMALGEGTIGGLFRHREIISFAYIIFAAAGLRAVFSNKRKKETVGS